MMKRRLVFFLALCLALPCVWAGGEEMGEKLYTGRTTMSPKVYASWEGTQGIDKIGSIPQGRRVDIYAVNPTFAYVVFERNQIGGYIRRVALEDIRVVDPGATPPYGVEFNRFIGRVSAWDAQVTSAPGGGDALITLHRGARVSLIGFETGYAKLIFKRQYGYIDSRLLGEMDQVYESAEDAGSDAPIASYTSFYKITEDESNQNRIVNLKVACDRLAMRALPHGADLDFNRDIGPYRASMGYLRAGSITEEGLIQGYGGGTCQVSSTLYNVLLQLPGITVLQRRAHGANGASYLPIGMDAAVGNNGLNLRFRNDYGFPIRIDGTVQDGALTIAIYKAE